MTIIASVMTELVFGIKKQMDNYHESNVKEYCRYVSEEEDQIQEIKEKDKTVYRVSQTSTRGMFPGGGSSNYNEGFAYNYWPITSYLSSNDGKTSELLERLGYRSAPESSNAMNIVNTSIIGADSLLGVKYILSSYPINGLILKEEYSKYNQKNVYENPYCLPIAFICEPVLKNSNEEERDNPFEYQNELYSQLLGEEAKIYQPLDYEITTGGDIRSGEEQTYEVRVPKGEFAIYGNLPWRSELNANLCVNDVYTVQYSYFHSPSVFYIPTEDEDCNATVSIVSEKSYNLLENREQFYALDLKRLEEVTGKLRKGEVRDLVIKNGEIHAETSGKDGQNMILSIPFDTGWRILLNGKEITPLLFADCLMAIPLVNGKNTIEMTYYAPWAKEGFVISIISTIVLMIFSIKGNGTFRKPYKGGMFNVFRSRYKRDS